VTTDLKTVPDQIPESRAAVAKQRRRRLLPATIVANGFLAILAIASIFPLYWALSTSFLPAAQINGGVQKLIPTNATLQNYVDLFTTTQFTTAMRNSALVSVAITAMGTVFAAAAGYAFGKLQFRGRNAIFLVLLLTMMIPPLVTVPVNFILMSKLGLINTLWAVILPQLAPAFGIFWMRQYAITSIPDTVLEAAEIDGAGTLRTFWTVGLPMMRPGLAGLAIYLFMMGWNQFLLPLTYLQSNEKQTYTVFLSNLNSSYAQPQTNLALATAILSTIPLLLVFVFGQRHFVAGLTAGAVKG
jgi:cellobiose transport system permease protein